MEIWEEIEKYEGLYAVSNFGRIKSVKKNKLRKLVKCKKNSEYLYVNLSKRGMKKMFQVHRLVAFAFLREKHFNGAIINHKDEDPSNNNVENLEWCTHKYNSNYGNRSRKISSRIKKPICMYSLDNIFIKKYDGAIDAEKDGFSRKAINSCLKKKTKSSGGYIWEYA